jgi:hypothetical protein
LDFIAWSNGTSKRMKESEAAVEAVPPLEDDDCDFQDESQSDDE